MRLAIVPRAERQAFCVCGSLEPACRCREFTPKTAENRWHVPPAETPGHATVAPCRCPSCDRDTRAQLARQRPAVKPEPELNAAKLALDGTPPACPLCARGMAYRLNSRDSRPFWGCSFFPDCQGTRPIV